MIKHHYNTNSYIIHYKKNSLNKGFISIFFRKIFREKPTHEELICNRWVKTVLPLRKEMLMHIDRICQKRNFDIIQVEMPWFISVVLSLPKQSKKVFVHHELGFVCRELEMQKRPKNVLIESYKTFICFPFSKFSKQKLLTFDSAVSN